MYLIVEQSPLEDSYWKWARALIDDRGAYIMPAESETELRLAFSTYRSNNKLNVVSGQRFYGGYAGKYHK